MRLDPEVKKQVEAALKNPVPPPTDPAFDELLLRLRKENPELADLLESGVLFDDLPTPEEETARAVARRSFFLSLKHRLLDRYDELTGEWVPSRPKQIAVGFLGLVVATSLWFALSTRETKAAQGGLPLPVATAPKPTPAPEAPSAPETTQTQAGSTAAQDSPTAPGSEPGNAQGNAQSSASDSSSVPPPPSGYSEVPPPPSGYPASTPPTGTSTTGGVTQPAPPQPLTLYAASPGAVQPASGGSTTAPTTGSNTNTATPASSQPLTLYTGGGSQGAQPLTLSRPAAPSASGPSSRPITGSVAEDVAASLQGQPVPSASASASNAPGGGLTLKKETQSTFAVRSVEGQGGQGGSFYLVGGPQAQAPVGTPPSAAAPSSVPGFPAQAPAFPPAQPSAPAAAATPPAAPYTLGTRLKGRLGVGVLIAEGTPGAVAIDAEDGSTWVGEVTLDETRRLKGKLTRVIKDGREYATSATLLDAEGTLGVAAKVREEAPSIAADLIRGSLRGVSDYVTAASQAKSVTVLPGGGVAQSSQTPPLELFMAGSLANLFALQQDKKAVVRVAQAEKGTEVVILVVPGQDAATGK
ncbi:hypothetical protein [Meiothermus hypogaeus]|uniref:Uncharacterized protein n=1 Tax=Meiothermus hypogaeus NBRC 106114 TaxID=1227553 RepID=A0A511R0J7_9DEIN|nr:hypothetical protein [Meiothermus hypogaeus]GEM83145.1 hypothetical protein MHY01S_13110 [Meiothermus hypogaeus NBRC 106114]